MAHTFGSLFAGVGGFDMGFEQAGWTIKFQVEIDPHCQKILNRHWPDVPKWGDVSTVNGAELPPVDCIIWGSPCQDMSVAGKRAGLNGERSGLFYEGIRIIKEMRDATGGVFPRWTVWENVAGALSSNRGADFGCILDEMVSAGAVGVEWALLDAQFFGVPQRRRRVFVVACYDPATVSRCPDPLLPVSESLPGDFAAGKQKRKGATGETTTGFGSGSDIANTIGASLYHHGTVVNQDANNGHIDGRRNNDVQSTAVIGFSHTQGLDAQPSEVHWPTLRMNGSGHAVAIGLQGNPSLTVTAAHVPAVADSYDYAYAEASFAAADAYDAAVSLAEQDSDIDAAGQAHHDSMVAFEKSRRAPAVAYDGRDSSDFVAQAFDVGVAAGFRLGQSAKDIPIGYAEDPGLASEGDGLGDDAPAVMTRGMAVRRLTPLECERLMGWPDDHTRWNADGTQQADSHRYKQCGNGVATPVAKWIAEHMKAVDG